MMYRPKVLVVDDDENILSAFRDFLKKERCTMIPATSAEDAAVKLQEQYVDLLVTDIRLKRQSGITFLMEARRLRRDLPIIVITGYPDLVSENDVRACGADYYFLKPLDLNKLREAVRKCLHLGQSGQPKSSIIV